MCRHRVPSQCVIAPYILEKLTQHKSGDVRDRALQTLEMSSRVRGHRDILGAIAVPMGILGHRPLLANNALNRTIYTSRNTSQLPGQKVRGEGDDATGDPAVDEAYDGLGDTYNFYKDILGRNSLDDNGLPLIASVHYGRQYDNAEWNGQQMLFGDGDGVYFNRFTIALDVIGHELTHGVTQNTAALNYHDQPGALNESFSDVFGIMVKHYAVKLKATNDPKDWLIGEGLLTNQVASGDPDAPAALRSMLHPGKAFNDPNGIGIDPQPADMNQYNPTQADNGGVHINSSIPNRAFALCAIGLGGFSWEKAGQIWYKTLLRLQPESRFQDCADLTYQIAGESGFDQKVVQNAWAQVAVPVNTAGAARAMAAVPADATVAALAARVDKLEELVKKLSDRKR